MANDREVSLRLSGDVSALQSALNAAENDLLDLAKVGKSISVLENADANVRRFQGELQAAQVKVRNLQAALSEAYAADADAPLLRNLEKQLSAAEKAAIKADGALTKSQAAIVRLNLDADKTGVSMGTLAARKAELATQTERLAGKIGGLKTQMAEAASAEKQLDANTRQVASAFGALDIRSAAAIKADIAAINTALGTLARSTTVSGAEFDRAYGQAQTKLAGLRAELTAAEETSQRAGKAIAGVGTSIRSLAAPLAAAVGAQEFVRANVAMESLERTMVQLTGSADLAAREIDYLKSAANRMGLDVLDASRAYVSLSAAAKGTALEGDGTRRVFEAVAGAMSKLGRSSADTEGALQAVSQMIGKGTVSVEEMRQQLAERLPGAMQATADATGVSVAELTEMIGSGKVLAEDLLPNLAAGLEKMYGTGAKAEGTVAAWNRMKNAISETFVFLGDVGIMTAAATALGWLATTVRGLTGAFELLGRIIGITFGALATFDWKHPIDSINAWRNAVVEAGNDIQKHLDKTRAGAEGAASAQTGLAESATKASKAAGDSGASWLAVVNAYEKVGESAEKSADQAAKSASARQEEGRAALSLASLLGSETDKREAGLRVAENDAAALRNLADARQYEAGVAKAAAEALAAVSAAEGTVSEAKRKAIKDATDKAAGLQAEADKAAAAALGATQHAAALQTESAALVDNSARVGELKAAAEQAAAALLQMRDARAAGAATAAELSAAEIAAAQAAALYRDALADQTDKIAQNLSIKQSQINVEQAGIRLAIEQQRTIYEVARARGDEYSAVQALMQIKRLEIQLAELTAQAKRAEAEAAMLTVQAKREELIASGQLTAAKEAELRAQEAGARVKQVESQIAGETARRMRELAEATDLGAGSASRASGHFDGLSGSLNGVAASARQAVAAMSDLDRFEASKYGNPVSSGGFNDGGHQASSSVGGMDILYRSGASVAEAKIAAKYFDELFRRRTQAGGDSVHSTEDNNRLIAESSRAAAEEAIALARTELTTGQSADLGASLDDITQMKLAQLSARGGNFNDIRNTMVAAAREAQNQVVRVDIRTSQNRQQSVNVSSQADAKALISTLEQLQFRTS